MRGHAHSGFSPTLGDHLGLGVEAIGIVVESVIAEPRVTPTSESEPRDRNWNGNVDPDASGLDAVNESATGHSTCGEDGRTIAIWAGVHDAKCFVEIIDADHTQNRSEHLLLIEVAVDAYVVDQARADKIAGFGRYVDTAVYNDVCAWLGAASNAPLTRSMATSEMSGPMSVPSSFPGPVRKAVARSAVLATSSSAISPTLPRWARPCIADRRRRMQPTPVRPLLRPGRRQA